MEQDGDKMENKSEKGLFSTNRHSCYILKYHLVVVTKYRKPVLTGDVEQTLYEITERLLQENWDCTVISMKCDRDHIHILFEAPPQVQLSKLVNNLKTVSSRLLRKEHEKVINQYYWKDVLWSRSYFIGCVSDVTEEIIDQYIKNQGL
jgi:putative transposase